MTAGRKRPTGRARHVTHQDGPAVPGRDVDGLNTKIGRAREKGARKAAKKMALEAKAQQKRERQQRDEEGQ